MIIARRAMLVYVCFSFGKEHENAKIISLYFNYLGRIDFTGTLCIEDYEEYWQ